METSKISKRARITWTVICSIGVLLGIIDFYLSWIRSLKTFDVMINHIFSIIGFIGAILLCVLWGYWKINDFVNFYKNAAIRSNKINEELIKAINNHADCLDTKKGNVGGPPKSESSFKKSIMNIEPLKIDLDEFNRNFK